VEPLDLPLAWASAATGQSQQATHRGCPTIQLVATDYALQIDGVFYTESARLSVVAPTDLYRAEMTFRFHSDVPADCAVTFLHDGRNPKSSRSSSYPFCPLRHQCSRTRATSPGPHAVPLFVSVSWLRSSCVRPRQFQRPAPSVGTVSGTGGETTTLQKMGQMPHVHGNPQPDIQRCGLAPS